MMHTALVWQDTIQQYFIILVNFNRGTQLTQHKQLELSATEDTIEEVLYLSYILKQNVSLDLRILKVAAPQ